MTLPTRRFHFGSAAIVFAAASAAWFWLALSMLEKLIASGVQAPPGAAMRLAVGVTVPMVIVTLIALVARNLTDSEAQSWAAAGVAFAIAAVGFLFWLSSWATSFS